MASKLLARAAFFVFFGLLAGFATASTQSEKPGLESRQMAELTRQLEGIVADFSSYLANDENRAFLSAKIKASPRKYVIVMRDFLAMAASNNVDKGGEHLFNLAMQLEKVEATMKGFGLPIPRIDLKLPVKAHREKLARAKSVYVAAIPLEDESEVKSITAYNSKGKRIGLSAESPPDIPTFVIGPAEVASVEPAPPLLKAEKPGEEENPERVVDDFVGIPWLKITDESEGWTCGDPEIYVRIKFWIWNFNQWIFINAKVDLPGVNDEHVWYWLGELGYNSLYRYLASSDWQYIVYEIWEADSGGHGNDDYLGSKTINWKNLPYGGYTHFNYSNGGIMVDRD